MAISKHGIRTVAFAMTLIGLSTSANAFACGGDWFPEVQVDPRIHGVLEAEKSIARGNYVAAAGSVVRMMPHIKTLQSSHDPLVVRADQAPNRAVRGMPLGLPALSAEDIQLVETWAAEGRPL